MSSNFAPIERRTVDAMEIILLKLNYLMRSPDAMDQEKCRKHAAKLQEALADMMQPLYHPAALAGKHIRDVDHETLAMFRQLYSMVKDSENKLPLSSKRIKEMEARIKIWESIVRSPDSDFLSPSHIAMMREGYPDYGMKEDRPFRDRAESNKSTEDNGK